MNAILTRNLDILRERFPLIATQIAECRLPGTRRTFVNERGIIAYQYQNGDKWNNLCSAYSPEAEASRQINSMDFTNSKLIFVLGEAGFYHVEEVCRRAPENSKVFLITHRPEYVRCVLESRDLSHLLSDERFIILLSLDVNDIKSAIDAVVNADIYTIPTFAVVEHPVEAVLDSSFHLEIQTFIYDTFTTFLANSSTTNMQEKWWTENFISNLPYMLKTKHVKQFKDTWSSKPVIIVAAGPSLNKNIHLLHQAKGKALIFCVDTAYRILEKHGIVPDMLFSLDGSPQNAAHLSNCNYAYIPYMLDAYSHHDLYLNHRGSKVLLTSTQSHKAWYEKIVGEEYPPDIIPSGGSVSTVALSFARWIDANPVIMVGQDLSYPNGQWYASGALNDKWTIKDITKDRPLYPVKDINGNQTYTTFDYLFYLRWIQQQIKVADRVYVNATEGGALREGVRIQSLEETLAEYCAEEQPIDKWRELLEPQKVKPAHISQVLRELKRSKHQLKAAIRYFQLMLSKLEFYIGELEQENYANNDEYTQYLAKANAKLGRLGIAQSYMDACSYSTVYLDKRFSESIDRHHEELSEGERVIIAARQMMILYNRLVTIANDGIAIHNEGLKVFKRVFSYELEMEQS